MKGDIQDRTEQDRRVHAERERGRGNATALQNRRSTKKILQMNAKLRFRNAKNSIGMYIK